MMDLTLSFPMEHALEIEDLFGRAEAVLEAEIFEIISRYAQLIADLAKNLCPVKTGFLRDSIYTEETEDGVDVLATAPYWGYQEFGTRHIEGKYFLAEALATYEEQMYAEIDRTVEEYFGEYT